MKRSGIWVEACSGYKSKALMPTKDAIALRISLPFSEMKFLTVLAMFLRPLLD
jgi:hypothetical protein